MSIQLLLERFPNHICHLGQTTEDHRLDLREESPALYLAVDTQVMIRLLGVRAQTWAPEYLCKELAYIGKHGFYLE